MSEKTDKYSLELDALVKEGHSLLNSLQYMCHPNEFKTQLAKQIASEKVDGFVKGLPDFKMVYQTWFSKAQAVIRQILPDRLQDFNSFYEYPKPRKDITFQNYMIKDALQGLIIRHGFEVKVKDSAAIPEFVQQLNILEAAKSALGSHLLELRAIVQADIFDSEIESARVLASAGYLRAAGAICGVVIEKHLGEVCASHSITIKKRIRG